MSNRNAFWAGWFLPSMVTSHDRIRTAYATGAPIVAKSTLPFAEPVSARKKANKAKATKSNGRCC
jgi:hypothetical protein